MRVLHLVTYPIEVPRHGGQARVANIVRTYEAAGLVTRTIAVYQPEIYGPGTVGPCDVAFPMESPHRDPALPLCTDIASADFAVHDPEAWRAIAETVAAFRPDVVQLEQPWLWSVVQRLRADGHAAPFRVVYSSQNVEAPLKRGVHAESPPDVCDAVVRRIEALEREVVLAADLTIAVTESDAATYRGWGGRRVVVASNGIVERPLDPARRRHWEALLHGSCFALFVGSAYPPNIYGFWEMFAPSMAFLAPDERVVVAGGIGSVLFYAPASRTWQRINESRIVLVGQQSEEDLAALISLASCIVLPITIGGGSNIKTAEAILSGKPVVGTTLSLRGYERALELPHVYRTDAAPEFRRLVKRALEHSLPPAGPERPEIRRSVLWSETLKALPDELRALESLAGSAEAGYRATL
jgi:glycosyltransferase involved in cell wall biosynthesis